MRRALAIFAFVSLLVFSAALESPSGCCGDSDCCKSGFCPMHHQKRDALPSDSAGQDQHCQHATNTPSQEQAAQCRVFGGCTPQIEAARMAPQMRAILLDSPESEQLLVVRVARNGAHPASALGFVSPPFEPPRLAE
jgi:hypothetical protein